jgi:hypothetical protein
MHRLAAGVAPLLVGSVFVVADLFLGPAQVVLGLVVIAPLLAASPGLSAGQAGINAMILLARW